ncbi:rRNA 2'-O-methyltransferase fibrillarin-like [Dendronephthya gigantea]|uniref:rRNA 2'-O-methyltransferase fibrillarin-like n=1 Tax=Dendronephthya gigantea TaxID=151771 RepID=UPI00106D30AE|nr:rRNA 2'-O-methyltransferase fibrillarin-like [Dendronephthya gigantea]
MAGGGTGDAAGGGGMAGGGAGGAAGGGGMAAGGAGGGAGGGGAGGMVIGYGGFPVGLQFSLKFDNGRCIYPENGENTTGTKLTLPPGECNSAKAKFTYSSEDENLKHVKTGYCVQPEGEQLTEGIPIVIAEPCDKKWAMTMTPGGSLKLKDNGKCIQPLSGSNYPTDVEKLVFGDNCDKPESKFHIEGIVSLYRCITCV